jgi:hypothetical protein
MWVTRTELLPKQQEVCCEQHLDLVAEVREKFFEITGDRHALIIAGAGP